MLRVTEVTYTVSGIREIIMLDDWTPSYRTQGTPVLPLAGEAVLTATTGGGDLSPISLAVQIKAQMRLD